MSDSADDLIAGRFRITERGPVEERGVDLRDGAPVLVCPLATTRTGVAFIEREEQESAAHVAASIVSPWVLPVRCATPRVVYDLPPPAERPRAPLALADAVECTLQVCDVLASAHAGGWTGLSIDVTDVRVTREGDRWRATVLIPPLPPRGRFPYAHVGAWRRGPVRRDLGALAAFLRDLALAEVPEALEMWGQMSQLWMGEGAPASTDDPALDALLVELGRDDGPCDAASFASLLAPHSRDPEAWRARVATWPRATRATLRRDFDRVVALGEADLRRAAERGAPRDPYIVLPLAAAWHGRACAANARGDADAAMRFVERAIELDPFARYLVTRGALRDGRGEGDGAVADYERAVANLRHEPTAEQRRLHEEGVLTDAEVFWPSPRDAVEASRALYALGVARWQRGDAEGAFRALSESLALVEGCLAQRDRDAGYLGEVCDEVEPLARRALVVVLRARLRGADDLAERWALAENLSALGRRDEALAEADRALAQTPDDRRATRRHARIVGRSPR